MISPKFSHRIFLDFETTGQINSGRNFRVFAKVICLLPEGNNSFKAACKSESHPIQEIFQITKSYKSCK